MFKKLLKWVFFGFLGLIALGFVIDANMSPEEKAKLAEKRKADAAAEATAKAETAKQEAESMPIVSAAEIAKAYEANTVAADQQFKDKKVKVSGTIGDINTNFMGNPYITMTGGENPFMLPQFHFDKGAADQIAKLSKGKKVTVICTGNGDVAKTPMLGDCSLVD